jgi:hypothetical protein
MRDNLRLTYFATYGYLDYHLISKSMVTKAKFCRNVLLFQLDLIINQLVPTDCHILLDSIYSIELYFGNQLCFF